MRFVGSRTDVELHNDRTDTPATITIDALFFLSFNLYEAVLRRGYPFRFSDDPAGYDALGSAAIRRMGEALAVIETHVEEPLTWSPDSSRRRWRIR